LLRTVAGARGSGGGGRCSDEGGGGAAEFDVVVAGVHRRADGLGGEAAVGAGLGLVVGREDGLDVGLGEPEEKVEVVGSRHGGTEARRHGGGGGREAGGEGWKVLEGIEIGGEEGAVGGGEGWEGV